jgi:hypothetical protein
LEFQADGRPEKLQVDHVIAGTGYRVDVERLSFMDPQLRSAVRRVAGTWPALDKTFESSVPGLFFVGLPAAATFGPLLRFVHGSRFTAPRVAAALTRARPQRNGFTFRERDRSRAS